MKSKYILTALLISGTVQATEVPDPIKTPGKADPTLTKAVICDPTFRTSTVRNVSSSTKNKVYASYNVVPYGGYCASSQGCEVDHLIPLTIGGSNDITNLWPQPYVGTWNAIQKDVLEVKLHKLVCDETIPLEQAQKEISTDWISAYKKYVK